MCNPSFSDLEFAIRDVDYHNWKKQINWHMAMLELLTLPYAFYLLYLSHWDDQNSKFFRIIVLIPRREFCFPIIWWLLLWLWLNQTPQISTSNICHAKQISSTSMTAKDNTHHAIPSSNSTKIRRMQLPYTKKNGKILHSCSIAEVFLAFGELSQVPLHKDSKHKHSPSAVE